MTSSEKNHFNNFLHSQGACHTAHHSEKQATVVDDGPTAESSAQNNTIENNKALERSENANELNEDTDSNQDENQ